ncbi:MAG TPA: helical backbone metal receptor [Syntrophales bacterium]|nr:helical backbone metal receptor [Syntrophales bacterium]HOL59527.1 helical backbone metal receptor [Syntrophales bacterium]HPO35617.1 helical backbone metal receptor [Syntrophales bacterium]
MVKSADFVAIGVAFWIGAFLFLLPVPATSSETVVRDSFLRPVKIVLPVQRAVFFEAYEFIPALKLWDRVVGISRYAYENDVVKRAMAEAKREIPEAGSAWNVNIETLLRIKPDLVITWATRREKVEYMERFGLKVLSLYPERVKEVEDVSLMLARIFEEGRGAKRIANAMDDISQIWKNRRSLSVSERRKVLWLGARPTSCAGRGGLADDLIRMCGAVNAAAQIRERYGEVPVETIVGWNPDVIFIWGHARYGPEAILHDGRWESVRAVREARVYRLPPWATCSPRVYLLGLWMAMKIYPEHYRDIDFPRVKNDFYERVFGLTVR